VTGGPQLTRSVRLPACSERAGDVVPTPGWTDERGSERSGASRRSEEGSQVAKVPLAHRRATT